MQMRNALSHSSRSEMLFARRVKPAAEKSEPIE